MNIQEIILRAMEQETARIVEEEAKKAAERVVDRVRGLTGEIATKVASNICFEGGRHEMRITVRLPEREDFDL